MVDKDLITVVVPVYNVEKYIKKCIDSIINQTYKNIEIILVNDGSTDNSGKICNDYAKKDCRIKVIHKENGGLSDARNFGIENTTGKYITFVDSDDYIEIDYVEYLYNLVVKNKVDISICSMFIDSTKKHINQGKKFKDNIFDTKKCYEYMLLEKGFTISAPAKLYLSELFRDIKYPTGMLCEDNGTTYKLIAKCDRIAYGCQSKYHYVAREDSIMRSTFNPKKNDMIILTDEMCNYIDENYPQLKDVTTERRIYARFNVFRQLINSPRFNDLKEELKIYLLNNKKVILKNRYSTKRDKLAIISLMIGTNFFKFSSNLYCRFKY